MPFLTHKKLLNTKKSIKENILVKNWSLKPFIRMKYLSYVEKCLILSTFLNLTIILDLNLTQLTLWCIFRWRWAKTNLANMKYWYHSHPDTFNQLYWTKIEKCLILSTFLFWRLGFILKGQRNLIFFSHLGQRNVPNWKI